MDLWQDIKFGVRLLAKARWFTLAAGTALALGIGTNTTVFTLVNAVLFRGLGIGLPIGLVGTAAVGQLLQSIVVQTSATDPLLLGTIVLVLAVVACIIACPAGGPSRSHGGVQGGLGEPSETEQPIDLHDQPAVAKLRETLWHQRIRIAGL